MSYTGRVENGVVVFDGPQRPAEGSVVRVDEVEVRRPVGEALDRLAGHAQGLPADLGDKSRPASIVQELQSLLAMFEDQPRRRCEAPWTDWTNGVAGGQLHACVYALWSDDHPDCALYIGETTGMGPRLWCHFKDRKPDSVQYLSDPRLDDAWMRRLFERFLIVHMRPRDNHE